MDKTERKVEKIDQPTGGKENQETKTGVLLIGNLLCSLFGKTINLIRPDKSSKLEGENYLMYHVL